MQIISITGTKGKTTVTRALSYVLHKQKESTLRVDTDGYYINEKQKGTLSESKKLFGLVPTVCPGKYLLAMQKYYPNFTAVLETAIGSSRRGGLGYRRHKVGIFTNVLEDHLGVTKRLQTREDIAKAKNFIFSAIGENGYAIFNADDKLVCSQLRCIPKKRSVTLLPVGFDLRHFDTQTHLEKGGSLITAADGFIILKTKNKNSRLIKIADIPWTFQGNFKPSVYNLMFILAGLHAAVDGHLSKKIIATLKGYRMDNAGGRLTLLENKQGVKILVDFAHEKYSLKEVADLAKKLSQNKTTGVLRLAPDRTDKMLLETGQFIANSFDYIFVYDKIDGIIRKSYISTGLTPSRKKGEISSIFLKGILSKKTDQQARQIIIEEKAIIESARLAEPGDVIVIICGDDHKRTLGYVKKYFKASFV